MRSASWSTLSPSRVRAAASSRADHRRRRPARSRSRRSPAARPRARAGDRADRARRRSTGSRVARRSSSGLGQVAAARLVGVVAGRGAAPRATSLRRRGADPGRGRRVASQRAGRSLGRRRRSRSAATGDVRRRRPGSSSRRRVLDVLGLRRGSSRGSSARRRARGRSGTRAGPPAAGGAPLVLDRWPQAAGPRLPSAADASAGSLDRSRLRPPRPRTGVEATDLGSSRRRPVQRAVRSSPRAGDAGGQAQRDGERGAVQPARSAAPGDGRGVELVEHALGVAATTTRRPSRSRPRRGGARPGRRRSTAGRARSRPSRIRTPCASATSSGVRASTQATQPADAERQTAHDQSSTPPVGRRAAR